MEKYTLDVSCSGDGICYLLCKDCSVIWRSNEVAGTAMSTRVGYMPSEDNGDTVVLEFCNDYTYGMTVLLVSDDIVREVSSYVNEYTTKDDVDKKLDALMSAVN